MTAIKSGLTTSASAEAQMSLQKAMEDGRFAHYASMNSQTPPMCREVAMNKIHLTLAICLFIGFNQPVIADDDDDGGANNFKS